MNTVVTSREAILSAAKQAALSGAATQLNIRDIAKRCGIAVGSVYNYFPTKADLTLALVAEVWQEIFPASLCESVNEGFLPLVEKIHASIQKGVAAYPLFFARHAVVVTDKAKGRAAMERLFEHMRGALLAALKSDSRVRVDAWKNHFTQEAFAAFVFDFLRGELMNGQDQSAFLKELIRRAIY